MQVDEMDGGKLIYIAVKVELDFVSDILAVGCRTHPVAVMRLGFWPPRLGHHGYDSG
jgi:hypothetical protein